MKALARLQLAAVRPGWWIVSVLSFSMLGFILWQLDLLALQRLAGKITPLLLVLSLAAFATEGVCSALRLWLLAPAGPENGMPPSGVPPSGVPPSVLPKEVSSVRWLSVDRPVFSRAMLANAWYVFYLQMLPARLGEIAGVGMLVRYLQFKPGGAVGCLILQRFMDLMVLTLLLVPVLLLILDIQGAVLMVGSGLLFLLVVWLYLKLELMLTFAATLGVRWRWHKAKVLRWMLALVLQARSWLRHQLPRRRLARVGAVTLVKWLASVVAVFLLLVSSNPGLGNETILIIGLSYIVIAVVPLHTVGGVGLPDLGLFGMLTAQDVAGEDAAAITLYCRVVVLLFAPLFLAVVHGCFGSRDGFRWRDRVG